MLFNRFIFNSDSLLRLWLFFGFIVFLGTIAIFTSPTNSPKPQVNVEMVGSQNVNNAPPGDSTGEFTAQRFNMLGIVTVILLSLLILDQALEMVRMVYLRYRYPDQYTWDFPLAGGPIFLVKKE